MGDLLSGCFEVFRDLIGNDYDLLYYQDRALHATSYLEKMGVITLSEDPLLRQIVTLRTSASTRDPTGIDLLEQMGLPMSHIERAVELVGDRNAGLEKLVQALREDPGETIEDAAAFCGDASAASATQKAGEATRWFPPKTAPETSSFCHGDDNTGARFAPAARDDRTSSATLGEDDEDQDLDLALALSLSLAEATEDELQLRADAAIP